MSAIPRKKRKPSTWMKGFVIMKSTRDDLDQSQLDAIAQIRDSYSKKKRHFITK